MLSCSVSSDAALLNRNSAPFKIGVKLGYFSTLTRINPIGNKGCKRKPPPGLGREPMGDEEKECGSDDPH